jgi:chitinase
MKAVSQYELDGVEFEYVCFREFLGILLAHLSHSWEFPGKQGIGCNIVSANDSANYLSFLQTLRSMSGPNLIISAAVLVSPFVGPDGKPLTSVSGFAQVLDYIGSCFNGIDLKCNSLMSHRRRNYEL